MSRQTRRVWIFDLDDTLHDASAQIFPMMNRAMTQFIIDQLQYSEDEAQQLRKHYWRIYGATLKGLVRHHGINPHHFLSATHDALDLDNMVLQRQRLRHLIRSLHGRKVIFTNAPQRYAVRVLEILGIADLFELVFSVESTRFHPKPALRGFRQLLRLLRVSAKDCVMLEDNPHALKTAKRIGMRTVWVTRALTKPCYVDLRIPDVLVLTRYHL